MYTYIHIVYFFKVAGRAENFRRVKVVSGGWCEWDPVSKLWVPEKMWRQLCFFDLKIKEKGPETFKMAEE